MRTKIYLLVGIMLFSSLILTSCQTDFSKPSVSTEITNSGVVVYTTDNALSPLEYTIAVNKEIGIAMNILEGHMGTGKLVARGDYPVSDELMNVEHSLDVLQETIDSVNLMNPPKDYTDERLAVVQRLTNAKSTLEVYQKYLEDKDMEHIQDAIELMEGDFTALKTVYNNMGE